MSVCVNHPENRAIYKCSQCGATICYSCYNEYQITRGRKHIGFCSEECKKQYNRSLKKKRHNNSGEAFRVLRKGFYLLFICLVFFIIFNPVDLYFENSYPLGIKYLSFLVISVFAYGMKLLMNFISIWFYGENPETLSDNEREYEPRFREKNAISIPRGNKKRKEIKKNINQDLPELKVLSPDERKYVINELKKGNNSFIFAYGIPMDEILTSVSKFRKAGYPGKHDSSVEIKIIICSYKEGETRIFFRPEIHPLHFYKFLFYLDTSNSVGFSKIREKWFMIKGDGESEYFYGISEDEEVIEICALDGRVTDYENIDYPFFKPAEDFEKIEKIEAADLLLYQIDE